jgi:hypothetical protein
MHVLHLIRVKADSHSDAQSIVENFLFDWGTENNWFTLLGSHCKENKSFSESFDEKWVTKDELLNDPDRFNSFLEVNEYYKKAFNDIAVLKDVSLVKKWDWYFASRYCKEMSNIASLSNPNKIDIWSDTFYDGEIDEPGLTELCYDGELTFIVLVDMHS